MSKIEKSDNSHEDQSPSCQLSVLLTDEDKEIKEDENGWCKGGSTWPDSRYAGAGEALFSSFLQKRKKV